MALAEQGGGEVTVVLADERVKRRSVSPSCGGGVRPPDRYVCCTTRPLRSASKVGLFLLAMTKPGEVPGDPTEAGHAERQGFESAWVVDQLVAGSGMPFLESRTTLAAVAAAMMTIRLGLGVSCGR